MQKMTPLQILRLLINSTSLEFQTKRLKFVIVTSFCNLFSADTVKRNIDSTQGTGNAFSLYDGCIAWVSAQDLVSTFSVSYVRTFLSCTSMHENVNTRHRCVTMQLSASQVGSYFSFKAMFACIIIFTALLSSVVSTAMRGGDESAIHIGGRTLLPEQNSSLPVLAAARSTCLPLPGAEVDHHSCPCQCC